MQVCVTGAGGFIGGHLCKRLKADGYRVVGVDWKLHEFFAAAEICDTFLQLDLRSLENCLVAARGCEWIFNLAADMGGMGFIQSNSSVITYNNTMISLNMMEAARQQGVKKLLYTSSACIYPEHIQAETSNPGLKEDDAWPAAPQDAYGLEKLFGEECVMQYCKNHTQDPCSFRTGVRAPKSRRRATLLSLF
jgi:nucleoside-diphosphate-sugar epimerase